MKVEELINELKKQHSPEFEHTVTYEHGWQDALDELKERIKDGDNRGYNKYNHLLGLCYPNTIWEEYTLTI